MKKVKTFQVSEDAHKLVMDYCKKYSLKANGFVENLLTKSIRSLNERESSQLFLQDHESD